MPVHVCYSKMNVGAARPDAALPAHHGMACHLLTIKRLVACTPDAAAMRKLPEAARRNLTDASARAISMDNRLNAACSYLMQCAMPGLWTSG